MGNIVKINNWRQNEEATSDYEICFDALWLCWIILWWMWVPNTLQSRRKIKSRWHSYCVTGCKQEFGSRVEKLILLKKKKNRARFDGWAIIRYYWYWWKTQIAGVPYKQPFLEKALVTDNKSRKWCIALSGNQTFHRSDQISSRKSNKDFQSSISGIHTAWGCHRKLDAEPVLVHSGHCIFYLWRSCIGESFINVL
jgi:hypothetical protein